MTTIENEIKQELTTAKDGCIACSHCGRVVRAEDAYLDDSGKVYCEECAEDALGVVRCADCGGWIDSETAFEYDGKYYCEDCESEDFFECDYCGSIEPVADRLAVYDERGREMHYCSYCAGEHAFRCADCGDLCDENGSAYVDGVGRVCGYCLENGDYYYCAECGNTYCGEDWDDDEGMCVHCAGTSEHIKGYHNAPSTRYFGKIPKQWRDLWRGIGIELEIDRNEHVNGRVEDELCEEIIDALGVACPAGCGSEHERVFFERDGSLENGFEIITQPHTVDEFFSLDWGRVLDACKRHGYKSHDIGTCGLHVHLSRAMFGATQAKQGVAIGKLIRFFDSYYPEMLKIARRTEEQANRWAGRYYTKNRKEATDYGTKKLRTGRYFAVNNTNYATVEIRIMRGTLNLASFLACIDVCVTLARNSRRVSWKNACDPEQWFEGARPATIEYIKSRGAFPWVFPSDEGEVEGGDE